MAASLDRRHDMVEAAQAGGGPAQTIEALAAFARVNSLAQFLVSQEIRLLEVGRAGQPRWAACASLGTDGANLPGQPDLHYVAGSRPFHQAQSTFGHQAPHRQAHGPGREAGAPRQPKNHNTKPSAALEPATPHRNGYKRPPPSTAGTAVPPLPLHLSPTQRVS